MELGETFFVDARMFQLEEWEEGGGVLLRGCSYMEMNTNSCRDFIVPKCLLRGEKNTISCIDPHCGHSKSERQGQ